VARLVRQLQLQHMLPPCASQQCRSRCGHPEASAPAPARGPSGRAPLAAAGGEGLCWQAPQRTVPPGWRSGASVCSVTPEGRRAALPASCVAAASCWVLAPCCAAGAAATAALRSDSARLEPAAASASAWLAAAGRAASCSLASRASCALISRSSCSRLASRLCGGSSHAGAPGADGGGGGPRCL
jgi:hypothetical protein